MAAQSVTLRSTSTTLFISASIAVVVFLIIIVTGPTSAFPLGLLALLPYLVVAFIVSGGVALTASLVLDQQLAWRLADAEASRPVSAPTASTFVPRNQQQPPAPRWSNEA